jgi:hypothetical protein
MVELWWLRIQQKRKMDDITEVSPNLSLLPRNLTNSNISSTKVYMVFVVSVEVSQLFASHI